MNHWCHAYGTKVTGRNRGKKLGVVAGDSPARTFAQYSLRSLRYPLLPYAVK
jgi:hypothetical protein